MNCSEGRLDERPDEGRALLERDTERAVLRVEIAAAIDHVIDRAGLPAARNLKAAWRMPTRSRF